MRRRIFLSSAAVTGLGLAAGAEAQTQGAGQADAVVVDWLGGTAPALATGASFDVPWPHGRYPRDQAFTLAANDGKPLPLQSWPLAWWPDGSLKWTGFASLVDGGVAGPFRLTPGNSAAPAGAPSMRVVESAGGIDLDTGQLQCRIPRQGADLIDSVTVDGRVVARRGRLVCTLEDRSETDTIRLLHFESTVRNAAVEQSGPVRAVVRIEGVHKAAKGDWE